VNKIFKPNQIEGNVKQTNKHHLQKLQSKAELTQKDMVVIKPGDKELWHFGFSFGFSGSSRI